MHSGHLLLALSKVPMREHKLANGPISVQDGRVRAEQPGLTSGCPLSGMRCESKAFPRALRC